MYYVAAMLFKPNFTKGPELTIPYFGTFPLLVLSVSFALELKVVMLKV